MVKNSNRLEELVNKKLDGQLSENESIELEELVFASTEAQVYSENMQQLHSSLSDAAQHAKNTDISREVMEKIGSNTSQNDTPKVRSLFSMHLMRYAAVMVLGLLLGSMLTYLLLSDPGRIERMDARASIANQGNKSYFYSGAGWMINFNQYVVDNEIVIFIVSRSDDDLDVQMKFNPQAYKIENASCVGCGFTPRIDAFKGLVDFYVSGEVVHKILLKNPTGLQMPVSFEIRCKDELLYNGEIFIR